MAIIHAEATAHFDPAGTATFWLVPGQVFDGQRLMAGHAIRIANDAIAEVAPVEIAEASGLPLWRTACIASPGFFDIQVNGGGGVLFNRNATVEGLQAIAAAHRQSGTTAILPTVITDAPEVMEKAAEAVIGALDCNGIAGIHIEGPHISLERKGAHNPAFIRPLDDKTIAVLRRLRAADVPVLLTLAPECVTGGDIAALVALGVVVSLGHTAADARRTRAAIAEGATCVTHLYNAMTPITSREPGVVGAALDSEIYCGFIADGHHVDDAVLRLAIRSRPARDRMVLVSDAMPTWNGPGSFSLYGETIRLEEGRLVNRTGSLAGVHIDMATSLARLVKVVGIDLESALRMATSNPARLMGLQDRLGILRPGLPADIVLIDPLISLPAAS